jgi:hypothetical protein
MKNEQRTKIEKSVSIKKRDEKCTEHYKEFMWKYLAMFPKLKELNVVNKYEEKYTFFQALAMYPQLTQFAYHFPISVEDAEKKAQVIIENALPCLYNQL